MSNIIFYFSGTGNSLKAAKTIAKELGDTEIVSMGKHEKFIFSKQYKTVGFVYPDYFWGLPAKVIEFIKNMSPGENKNAYWYSIATYGGDIGNAVYQLFELLLSRHNIKLNNGMKLKMFSNYVVMYDMRTNVDEITKKSNEELLPLIESIKKRENNKVSKWTKLLSFINRSFVKTVPGKDTNFTVNDKCTGCGICGEVCPVKNIEMKNNLPQYNHKCEQCLACIQYCPLKAINYKNATQNRRRYSHPDISHKELSLYNNR
jgi:ferredoxin/flavodoxin